jgi:hypothetical protein
VNKTVRITIALDDETAELLEKMKEGMGHSQSEIMRQTLRFYNENKDILTAISRERLHTYMDMLLSGEHVILDVDHWLLLLNLVESSPEKEGFWKGCREVARNHAEQLKQKVTSAEDILSRLETCNFFKVNKNAENDFTLVLGSEISKKFIRVFLKEFLTAADIEAEIKENLAKIRIIVKDGSVIRSNDSPKAEVFSGTEAVSHSAEQGELKH